MYLSKILIAYVRVCLLCGVYLRLAGPGTVFIQATNSGRYSRAIAADRAAQRPGVGGAGDMMKAAVVTIGLVVFLLAFFDVN